MITEVHTEISKIRAYQAYHAEAAKVMRPRLEKAIEEARTLKQTIFREVVWYHDEQSFVCVIQANAIHARVIIYQMVATEKFFQAIAYDITSRIYYFFSNHFFEQYAERNKIEQKSHLGILVNYARHNTLIAFKYSNPHELAGEGFTGWVKNGICFGAIRAANIFVFKTFVTHGMITAEQGRSFRKLQKKYMAATRAKMFALRKA